MQLSQQLKLKQSQSLVMTPQLQQAIKLLQMTNIELCQYLENQQLENPFLENPSEVFEDKITNEKNITDKTNEISSEFNEGKISLEDSNSNYEYENRFDQDLIDRPKLDSPNVKNTSFSSEDFNDLAENIESKKISLRQHLMEQVNLEIKESKERIIASFLVDFIEPSGWLTTDLNIISKEIGVNVEIVENILFKLQKFEPSGIFARNLKECLEIQLKDKNEYNINLSVILDNIDLLAKGEINQLIRLTNTDLNVISKEILKIKSLNPKPGEYFIFDESYQNSPDIIVYRDKKEWKVELNRSTLPAIKINEDYINNLNKNSKNDSEANFIVDNISSARWLKRSVEQRNNTTLTIASAIVAQQKDFFEYGLSHLKPMVLRDIAKSVNMHESTVSRVTTGLMMDTPRGCFALKYFFSVSLNSCEDGETYAATAVRETIKKLISNEKPSKPLSDEAISVIMKEDGIDLARRTVAKYREIMKIPSSAQRRRQTRLAVIK